jgi:hypothetical protein
MPKHTSAMRVALTTAVVSCLVACQSSLVAANAEYQSTLALEHALGSGHSFVPRGEVIVTADPASKKLGVKLSNPAYEFSSDERDALRALVAENDMYTVRVVLPALGDSEFPRELIASVPACALLNDNMNEVLHFHMDKMGGLSAISFSRFPESSSECTTSVPDAQLKFQSVAIVSLPTEAMVVPKSVSAEAKASLKSMPGMAGAHINVEENEEEEEEEVGPDGEKRKKVKKEPTDMYSLAKKYWYIVVPLAISMLLPADSAPPEGAAGKGAKGRVASSAAQAAGGGGGAGRRPGARGKKSRT